MGDGLHQQWWHYNASGSIKSGCDIGHVPLVPFSCFATTRNTNAPKKPGYPTAQVALLPKYFQWSRHSWYVLLLHWRHCRSSCGSLLLGVASTLVHPEPSFQHSIAELVYTNRHLCCAGALKSNGGC